MAGQVHFELFVRKTPPAPWALQMATEDRGQALSVADDLLADGRACAVRVCKETLDPETMEFQSVTILTKGAPEQKMQSKVRDAAAQPPCNNVHDLYTAHARETIGRALDDWLARNGVTAFELMHRPDLVERLEASGVEFQHALQKVAIPESQATGQPVHDIIRAYQKLTQAAMERVIAAGRKGRFPDLGKQPVADVARRLVGDPDRAFLMGGAICAAMAEVRGWSARLDRLMDLADQSPEEPAAHALLQVVIEQVLCEMFASRAAVADILGADLDPGGVMAALVSLSAPAEVKAVARMDAHVARMIPPVEGPAARLGARLAAGEYKLLAAFLARRVLRELMGPRRLRPTDASGEIDILRALAMTLTASAGRLLTLEEVQAAFVERSKSIVTADFVQAYLGSGTPALREAEALLRLCENVTGAAAKRAAARWMSAAVTALRFEKELRAAPETAAQKLAILALLQRSVRAAGLTETAEREITLALGAVGGLVEADARLAVSLARAPAPVPQKLALLLKLAAGDAAPLGPAADRAKAEALRLMRDQATRDVLSAAPGEFATLKPLMQAAGLAA
ncbi:MAG TPA: hypothetical protein VGB49_05590 [Caulobacteraceae bacterium]